MAKNPPHKQIVRAMKARKMSNADLARATGASTGTVANWVTGKRGVGPAYAFKLKEVLGLNPEIFFATSRRRPAPAQVAA